MEADVGLKLKKISEGLGKKLNAKAKKFGLTFVQCRVLLYLYENAGRKVTQRDIEEYLGATHVTVSGIICRMKMHGFVRVETDPSDRRAKNLSLTQTKHNMLEKMSAESGAVNEILTAGFSDEEREKLDEYLGRMYENVMAAEI